ncbi:MAG: hypothetical protein OHK0053_36470 [Microscillaceae bacterium]
MKHCILPAILIWISLSVQAQITFEKAYFIDNEGRKVTCWIKNLDWKNNPKEFEYQLTEQGEVQKGDLNNVQAFEIEGGAKYVRFTVDIDYSTEDVNKLTTNMQPVFERKEVFLKVLLEGKGSLYIYEEATLKRFLSKETMQR